MILKLISVNFRFHTRSLFIRQTLRKDKSENKYAVSIFVQEKTIQDTRKYGMMNGLGRKKYYAAIQMLFATRELERGLLSVTKS